MAVPAFRLNYGRVTIRYGEAGTMPQILWDGTSLINAQLVLDELVPDACTALSFLCEKDAKVGYRATDLFFESFTSAWIGLLSQGKIKDAVQHWVRILTLVRKWEEASKSRIQRVNSKKWRKRVYAEEATPAKALKSSSRASETETGLSLSFV